MRELAQEDKLSSSEVELLFGGVPDVTGAAKFGASVPALFVELLSIKATLIFSKFDSFSRRSSCSPLDCSSPVLN